MQMGNHTLEMFLAALLGIVVKPILNGSADNVHRLDIPVGFCHYSPVYAARLVKGRGTMVFHCFGHYGNLFVRKPLAQILVLTNNPCRDLVMMLTTFAQSCIMIGCNGIYHIDIDIQTGCQFKALTDDHPNMLLSVRFVETVVTRQDILLDILLKGLIRNLCHNDTPQKGVTKIR